MTPQEIFDQAVGGVIRQGNLAVRLGGSCQYRTSTGLACAVGQLIDDAIAREWDSLECTTITSVCEDLGLPSHLDGHLALLEDLQECHDSAKDVSDDAAPRLLEFLTQAKTVARDRGLECRFTEQDVIDACGG